MPATEAAGERQGFDPRVWKFPWRRAQQPTPVFLPGESHGQRNLVGYSPWGCKEVDMTELLSRHNGSELKLLRRAVMEGGTESKGERERERKCG